MNRIIASILLTAAPALLFAQLKVKSDGTVHIKDTANYTASYMSVGDLSETDFENSGYMGIHALRYESLQYRPAVAVFGEGKKLSLTSNTSAEAIGVWGNAYGAAPGHNIGVLGTTIADCVGVGLYATNEGDIAPYGHHPYGTYAAYFYGDTYSDGNLTTNALYNLSDIRLKKNIVPLAQSEASTGSALESLQNLEVLEYNLESPSGRLSVDGKEQKDNRLSELKAVEAKRRHYGVSAQELQKIYPDLVLEGQDGYLAVNYTELVPILIRSIQELKAELDEVRGNYSDKSLSRGATTDVTSAATSSNILYRNTPNPFKEQTVIRFSLADDAQDAAICIFDMTGKMLKKMPVSSGETSVTVSGWELGEGMFLYTLIVNGREIDTKRMIITK